MNTPSPVMKNDPERAAAAGYAGGWGHKARRSGQSLVRRLAKQRERAVPPMTKALSAALSARSDGFDDVDGSPECGVYTQMRGIEQVRVGRRLQRGGRAPGIALVAP